MATKAAKTYRVRMIREDDKKFYLMRFKQLVDLGQLVQPTLGRQEVDNDGTGIQPTQGEGSEFGRKRREDARMRKRGYDIRPSQPEDLSWELKESKKDGKRFIGRKEGGVNTSSSYFMLCQCADGAFEAHPLSSWYDFNPGIKHNTFTAEEAEEKYLMKNKTLNYFSLMLSKKMQAKDFGDDEVGKVNLLITDHETGENWSEDSDREDPEIETRTHEKGRTGKSSRNKKPLKSTESASGGDTTDDGEMESCEVDYISDSSESASTDKEMDTLMEDAKQKTKENSEEEESNSSQDERDLTEEGKELNALIKKQKSGPGSSDELDVDPDALSHEEFIGKDLKGVNKRTLEKDETLPAEPEAKRMHIESNPSVVDKEEVVYYLKRKPISTKDLVRKFCKKKTGMDKKQVLKALEKIISSLPVDKTSRKGKVYLALKS